MLARGSRRKTRALRGWFPGGAFLNRFVKELTGHVTKPGQVVDASRQLANRSDGDARTSMGKPSHGRVLGRAIRLAPDAVFEHGAHGPLLR